MRVEVELKVPVESLSEVEGRLVAMGAAKLFEERQVDVYLQHPCRDFASTDEALRLRLVGGRCTLTYKGPKLSSTCKARREVEVEVSSYEGALSILEALGFRRVASIVKDRRAYSIDGLAVYLDSVDGLGCFVEVEAPRGLSINEAESRVRGLAERLGLPLERATTKSYLELALEKAEGLDRRGA